MPDLDDVVEARLGQTPRDDDRPGNTVDRTVRRGRPAHVEPSVRSKAIW